MLNGFVKGQSFFSTFFNGPDQCKSDANQRAQTELDDMAVRLTPHILVCLTHKFLGPYPNFPNDLATEMTTFFDLSY